MPRRPYEPRRQHAGWRLAPAKRSKTLALTCVRACAASTQRRTVSTAAKIAWASRCTGEIEVLPYQGGAAPAGGRGTAGSPHGEAARAHGPSPRRRRGRSRRACAVRRPSGPESRGWLCALCLGHLLGRRLEGFHHRPVLVAAAAIQASREQRGDLQHILHQIVLERGLLRGVDDDDLGANSSHRAKTRSLAKRCRRCWCAITRRPISPGQMRRIRGRRPFLR